jgi:hypothetical protein
MTEMILTIGLAICSFGAGWYAGKIHMIVQEIRKDMDNMLRR